MSAETIREFENIDKLALEDRALLQQAIESREQAYAPYSRFYVGAAVQLANGHIVRGNNQENAVYPNGLCAERVAIFAAHANYPKEKIITVAITCRNTQKPTTEPRTSCGSCRQAMLEYELNQAQPIRVLFYGETGRVWLIASTKLLLPFYFDKSAL